MNPETPTIERPAIVKQIGQMTIVFSAYMIFTNSISYLLWTFVFPLLEPSMSDLGAISVVWRYFPIASLFLALLGIVNLIAGIFLLKRTNWARVLIVFNSVLFLLVFAIATFEILSNLGYNEFVMVFAIMLVANLAILTTPSIVSLYYLTQSRIAEHFE
jgi:hypothetical protein